MFSITNSSGITTTEPTSLYDGGTLTHPVSGLAEPFCRGAVMFWLVLRMLDHVRGDNPWVLYGPRLATVSRVYSSWLADVRRVYAIQSLGYTPQFVLTPMISLVPPPPADTRDPVEVGCQRNVVGLRAPPPPPAPLVLHSLDPPTLPSAPRGAHVAPSKAMPVSRRTKAAGAPPPLLPMSTLQNRPPLHTNATVRAATVASSNHAGVVPPLLPLTSIPNRPPRPFLPLCPLHPIFPPGHFGPPVIGVATGLPYPMDAHLLGAFNANLRDRSQ